MFDYVKSMFPAHSDQQIQSSINKHQKNEDAIVSELLSSQPQRKPVSSSPGQTGGYAVQQLGNSGYQSGGRPVEYGQQRGEFGYNQSYHVGRGPNAQGYSHPNQLPGGYPSPDQFYQPNGMNGSGSQYGAPSPGSYPSYPPTGSQAPYGSPHTQPSYPPTGSQPPYGSPHAQPSYPPTTMHHQNGSYPAPGSQPPYGNPHIQQGSNNIASLPRVPTSNPPQRTSGNPIMSNENYNNQRDQGPSNTYPSGPSPMNDDRYPKQQLTPNAPRLESQSKEEILKGLEEIVETQNKVIRVLQAKIRKTEKEAAEYDSQVLEMSFNNEVDESAVNILSQSVMDLLDKVASNQLNPQQKSFFFKKIETEAKRRTHSRFVEDSDSN